MSLPTKKRKIENAEGTDVNHSDSVPPVRIKNEISRFDFGDSNSNIGRPNFTQGTSTLSSVQTAVSLNEQLRNTLRTEITRVKDLISKNKEKLELLREIYEETVPTKNSSKSMSCIRAISIFAAPYFRDDKKMNPPVNNDTRIKTKRRDVNAYLKPARPWHTSEFKKLQEGIISYALLTALKPYKRKRDHLRCKLKDQNLTDEDIEEVKDKLEEVEQDAYRIRKMSKKELLDTLDETQIDWFSISSTNLQGARSPEECEQMYINFLSPNINKSQFTKEEDAHLQQLAEDYQQRNWDEIARALGTRRSPIQCFDRYQNKLNPSLRKSFWTPEEDQLLVNLVKKYRVGMVIPWNRISLQMPLRTRQQLINRYERSISQFYNRGPWTVEEDALLLACMLKFGTRHWAKIHPFFKRRSSYAIRERYVNALQPDIKFGSWSLEEDRKLVSCIRKYGYGKWAKICQHITGRTDNMCLNRATRMLEYSVKYHSDNGVEYDIDQFNPVLFAKILRPLPARVYRRKKVKEKSDREAAIAVLSDTLRKVAPDIQFEDGNLLSICAEDLNLDVLHMISEELHKSIRQQEQGKHPYIQRFRYQKMHPTSRKVEKSDSEGEIEYAYSNEIQDQSMEETLPKGEREKLISILTTMFETAAKIMPPKGVKRELALNSREAAETSLYKAFLCKRFQCLSPCDPDDELDNVVFQGVDYSETLETVVSYFVQPPVYDNNYTVLAPNVTTLTGLEALEAMYCRYKSMRELVRFTKPSLDYVMAKQRKKCPKCLQCLVGEEGYISTQVSPEVMISDMKEENFLIDPEMQKAAFLESAATDECTSMCSCSVIEKSREAVQRFRQRFLGCFMWPGLMSVTDFSEEQVKMICSKTSDKKKDYFWKVGALGRPKNPFDAELAKSKPAQASVSGVNGRKPRRKRQKRFPNLPPEQRRKSGRSCVLNRKCFGYQSQSMQSEATPSKLPKQEPYSSCQPEKSSQVKDQQPEHGESTVQLLESGLEKSASKQPELNNEETNSQQVESNGDTNKQPKLKANINQDRLHSDQLRKKKRKSAPTKQFITFSQRKDLESGAKFPPEAVLQSLKHESTGEQPKEKKIAFQQPEDISNVDQQPEAIANVDQQPEAIANFDQQPEAIASIGQQSETETIQHLKTVAPESAATSPQLFTSAQMRKNKRKGIARRRSSAHFPNEGLEFTETLECEAVFQQPDLHEQLENFADIKQKPDDIPDVKQPS